MRRKGGRGGGGRGGRGGEGGGGRGGGGGRIGIAASSTILPIATSVANDGPNQVLANRWERELSRLMASVTSTFFSIGNSRKWKQTPHLSRLEAVDRL